MGYRMSRQWNFYVGMVLRAEEAGCICTKGRICFLKYYKLDTLPSFKVANLNIQELLVRLYEVLLPFFLVLCKARDHHSPFLDFDQA